MHENKYLSVIEMLINETKEKKMSWDYVDKNKELCREMNWSNDAQWDSFDKLLFSKIVHYDEEKSFFTHIGEMDIVLFTPQHTSVKLFFVPETRKNIVCLGLDEYGEYITRLLNLVRSQFPDANDLIDSLLNNYN